MIVLSVTVNVGRYLEMGNSWNPVCEFVTNLGGSQLFLQFKNSLLADPTEGANYGLTLRAKMR